MTTATTTDSATAAAAPKNGGAPIAPASTDLTHYRLLDVWRGIAALWVLGFHASATIHTRNPAMPATYWDRIMRGGHVGVELFFVISGYCIAVAAVRSIGRAGGPLAFAEARLKRIYPPYWAALLLGQVLFLPVLWLYRTGRIAESSMAAGMAAGAHGALYYVANLTLTHVPLGQAAILMVSWTLAYEMAFYLICALCLLLARTGKNGPAALLGCLHAITLLSLALLAGQVPLPFPLDLWPFFGLGVLVFDLLYRPDKRLPMLLTVAALAEIAILVGRGRLLFGSDVHRYDYPIALAFAALLVLLRPYDGRLAGSRALRWLGIVGTFSFSLYLIHFHVVGAVGQVGTWLLGRSSSPLAGAALFIAMVAISIGAAWIFYSLVELPSMRWAKKKPGAQNAASR